MTSSNNTNSPLATDDGWANYSQCVLSPGGTPPFLLKNHDNHVQSYQGKYPKAKAITWSSTPDVESNCRPTSPRSWIICDLSRQHMALDRRQHGLRRFQNQMVRYDTPSWYGPSESERWFDFNRRQDAAEKVDHLRRRLPVAGDGPVVKYWSESEAQRQGTWPRGVDEL